MLNKTQCGEGWHQEPWNQPTPFPTQVPQASWQPVNPIQTIEELWDLRGKLHTQKKLFSLFYKGYCASYMTKFFQILQCYLHQDDLR